MDRLHHQSGQYNYANEDLEKSYDYAPTVLLELHDGDRSHLLPLVRLLKWQCEYAVLVHPQ